MDKNWMRLSRVSSNYFKGLDDFLDFAFTNASINGEIVCPCVKCGNGVWVNRLDAKVHLICDGFMKGYTSWIAHGEAKASSILPPSFLADTNILDEDERGGDARDDIQMMSLGNHIVAENLQISDYEENVPQEEPDNQVARADDVHVQRKVRGPTRMKNIWCLSANERLKIEINQFGQPIDGKTPDGKKLKAVSSMTHFMGSIIKTGDHAKVYKSWKEVSDAQKNDMVDLVKAKFDIPPGCEPWLLASFAKKLRSYRADLKKAYYDPTLSAKQQRKNIPRDMKRRTWIKLLKYWEKEKVQELSLRNKANRKFKIMTQTTGKKSFARCAEELKENLGRSPTRAERFLKYYTKKDGTPSNDESAQAMAKMNEEMAKLQDGAEDNVGPDDIFAKVIGKDKDGRARMFGLGVSTSDVWGQIPSRVASYRLSMQMQGNMKKMEEKLDAQSRLIADLQSKFHQNGGSEASASNVSSASTSIARQSISAHESQPLERGSSVYLKSIMNPAESIAKGYILSLNPLDEVGGEELGPNWCEVHIDVAVKRDEHLVRPYGFFKTIGDVLGATVAWPCPFIEAVVDVDDW